MQIRSHVVHLILLRGDADSQCNFIIFVFMAYKYGDDFNFDFYMTCMNDFNFGILYMHIWLIFRMKDFV